MPQTAQNGETSNYRGKQVQQERDVFKRFILGYKRLKNGNKNFFGQLRSRFSTLENVENSVEIV